MISSELKIYKDTYDFVLNICKTTRNFNGEFKNTIRDELIKDSMSLFEYIELANRFPKQREIQLTNFLLILNKCKIKIRLSADLKLISIKQQAFLDEQLILISKQATSWKNSALNINE